MHLEKPVNTWIKQLLKSLDEHVDESTRQQIMAFCGETCPFTHLPDDKLKEIKRNSPSEEAFLESLCVQWRLQNEDGEYFVVFDQCYCPLVNEDIQDVSQTLCYCTLGNLKRKFTIGLGRKVDVRMEKSILAGDNECRFHVQLKKTLL